MALITMVSGAVQSDIPPLAQASEREASLPWWAWLLIVMILAWLLVRWLNQRRPRDTEQPPASYPPPSWSRSDSGAAPAGMTATRSSAAAPDAAVEAPPTPLVERAPVEPVVEAPPTPAVEPVVEALPVPAVEPAPIAVAETVPVKPDDLTIVEGIGPKISALLVRSGIRTFDELAVTDIERLRQILLEVGYRVNDPATWPAQARLAAVGDWDGLKAMQDELKGGRRA